jgi:hypothetical protein
MACARTSFPVPLSPVRRMVASLAWRLSTRWKRRVMAAERAIMPEKPVGDAVPVDGSSSAGRTMMT